MKIQSVFDQEFLKYGRIVKEYDFDELIGVVKKEFPAVRKGDDVGIEYQASYPPYEETSIFGILNNHYWGGLPCQFGILNGHNFVMNSREYHRCTEILVAVDDMVLMLGDLRDIKIINGKFSYDTGLTELILLPKNTAIEMYQTALHYGPCSAHRNEGYRSVCILPRFVNFPAPTIKISSEEDKALRARGTWVITHPDAPEAKDGAYVGLTGDNLNIQSLLDS